MSGKININRLMKTLERKYKDCDGIFIAKKRSMSFGGKSLKIQYPAIFEKLCEFIGKERGGFDSENVVSALSQCEGLSYGEIGMISDYIFAVILLRTVDGSLTFDECISLLRDLEALDFDVLLTGLSECENLLHKRNSFSESTEQTKSRCRRRIRDNSLKRNISEIDALRSMSDQELFGCRHAKISRIYIPLIYLSAALITAAALIMGISPVLSLLCFVPLTEFTKQICDRTASKIIISDPPARINLENIPDGAKTLVVITTLLKSEKDTDIFNRLEEYYCANRDKNVRFGILADLSDSEHNSEPSDSAVFEACSKRVEELNKKYNGSFCLFIRSRFYSEGEKRFIGWERKRGAVLELARLICNLKPHGNSIGFSTVVCDEKFLHDVKYIVTLDSDTRLYTGAVREMVGSMVHPANTPVIRDKRVVGGYGVMQPRMETSLRSARKTPFTVLQSNGGSDIYSNAAYETYQSVFGEGIFCGKGIFDVHVFASLLDDAFPDESVLSHDLLEGSRLRTAALTDISLTDSLPKTPSSFFMRLHRWIRGDIQSLAFAMRHVRNAQGKNIINPVTALSKYKIYDNIRRASVPVFTAAVVLLGAFSSYPSDTAALFMSFLYIIFPSLVSLVRMTGTVGRNFFGNALPEVKRAVLNLFWSVMSLFYLAYVTCDAILRALYRMLFSKRKMLEWTTADAADKAKNSLMSSFIKMSPSVVAGAVLAFLSPHLFYRFIGIMWILLPPVSVLIGKEYKYRECVVPKEKVPAVTKYAFDMWRFYEASVTSGDNFLPPDNRQLSPVDATAHRTSPTNIGLYLLSCLAAYDFGFITDGELLSRITNTLNTVMKLPKFNGHLYNWYDTETLEVIGHSYVSTVDSGNFVCCLITLQAGISDIFNETDNTSGVISQIENLVDGADFSVFYNRKKKLFSIGYDTLKEELSENCYDLLMSEARTASYLAVANGTVSRDHWSALSRPVIGSGGKIGIASWGGTMFEYFMPSLILPVPYGSLSHEALLYALKEQRHCSIRGVWGKSESGYYAFDAAMNYQYKAFGVQKLGLRHGLDEDAVISPYSSFLVLPFSPSAALRNLDLLKSRGLYGEFGFYESIDMNSKESAVVRSYMAHHTGMSIVSAANACFGNIFVKRFMKSAVTASAFELLEEKVPADTKLMRSNRVSQNPASYTALVRIPRENEKNTERQGDSYTALISNGSARIIASADGSVMLSCGNDDLTPNPFLRGRIKSLHVALENDGAVIDLLKNANMTESESNIVFSGEFCKCRYKVRFGIHRNYRCLLVNIELSNIFGHVCPMIEFEPVIAPFSEYSVHPAFYDLSVESEFVKDNGVLLFRRRPRTDGEKERDIAVSFESSWHESEFLTRRDSLLPLMYSEDELIQLASKKFDNLDGACIIPFCAMKKRSSSVGGKYSCDFLISYGYSRDECISVINSVRSETSELRQNRRASSVSVSSKTAKCFLPSPLPYIPDKNASRFIPLLLTCVTHPFPRTSVEPLMRTTPDGLWRFGISGDIPVVCFELTEAPENGGTSFTSVVGILSAHRYLMICGIHFDLVILYSDDGDYLGHVRYLLDLASRVAGNSFINKKDGGVFFCEVSEESVNVFKAFSCLYSTLGKDTLISKLSDYAFKRTKRDILSDFDAKLSVFLPTVFKVASTFPPVADLTESILDERGGSFERNGFLVRKSEVRAPWSYIYANCAFGTLVTQNSLGYTWKDNCREKRVTLWDPDNMLDFSGEHLILNAGGTRYDMCACSERVFFGYGNAEYRGCCGGVRYSVCVGVDAKLPVKMIIVRTDGGETGFEIKPQLDSTDRRSNGIKASKCGDTVIFNNLCSPDFTGFGFIHRIDVSNNEQGGCETIFLLGAYPENGEKTLRFILRKYTDTASVLAGYAEYEAFTGSVCKSVELHSEDTALDLMINRYLPYQAAMIRMTARCGFYQSGGAFGFRDQLQDSIAALYFAPEKTKNQIIRSACHQYSDGDAMHWWHNRDGKSLGIRTRCSDDYLWLVYVTSLYVRFTGDHSILNYRLPYIDSPVLNENEKERCETASRTKRCETLYMHCIRAIDHALESKGKHGLPLIGTGDWNDGMSSVGDLGIGESVWLGFFLSIVLRDFAPICIFMDGKEAAKRLLVEREALLLSCERAWDKDRYARAYFDCGEALGVEESEFCKIDLLPQAFSVMAGADPKKSSEALDSAYQRLYDSENKIFRLFDPPFLSKPVRHELDPGYIRGYVPGVRENGGQYTHAAIWGALAFLRNGDVKRGTEILLSLNPARRCLTPENSLIYRGEPYFLAGDVYTNESCAGRAGWTLYTGAAAWFYTVTLKELLGLNIEGECFTVSPKLSKAFPYFRLMLNMKDTVYDIEASIGKCERYEIDGVGTSNSFRFDKITHILKITVENHSDMV
ncbi:MAG: glucoamylase family protein [Firmicutes bacterium]|nr:glucoamylase family protein [Bacillota bacterium]